jgi:hypothetical protein
MNDYRSENSTAFARLNTLLDRLSPQDLAHGLPNGWSIADTLVHLAFWDAYGLSWLQSWKKGVTLQDTTNIDTINTAVTALSRSIPAQAVVALVRQNAEAVDREADSLTPALSAAIAASGQQHLLFRSWHRNEHLATIESELQ